MFVSILFFKIIISKVDLLGLYSAMNFNTCTVLCNYYHNQDTDQFNHTSPKSLLLPLCSHTLPLPQSSQLLLYSPSL